MGLAIIPLPRSVTVGAGAPFRLLESIRITGDAVARDIWGKSVAARTGHACGTGLAARTDEQSPAGAIDLRIIIGGAPESYAIAVDEASVKVTAADPAGLFYAVQTLGQLLTEDAGGWSIPAVEIEDAPRFAYRGVMLDVARHFFPVQTVQAYIDRASALKFNHLHLHLSDDQGWRLELASAPRLTDVASATSVGGDPGGFYTRADYQRIVQYAAAHHMVVVPEFDVPGHTHAVGLAYPELAEAPVISEHIREIVRDHGGDMPRAGIPYDGLAVGFSSLKIHDEATYAFLSDVFGELAELTPGPYLHIGGDEALGTDPADFAMFIARASSLVAALGKTPIAWHEAGSAAGLEPTTIGQYWGFTTPTEGMDEKARGFVRHGARLILSPADASYLDMKPHPESALGLTWANGPTSLQRAYAWDPVTVIDGLDESDILGVEAPLWTETVRTLADIDALAFPRIAAAAEIAWSPAVGDARTWESFRRRVDGSIALWRAQGITVAPEQIAAPR